MSFDLHNQSYAYASLFFVALLSGSCFAWLVVFAMWSLTFLGSKRFVTLASWLRLLSIECIVFGYFPSRLAFMRVFIIKFSALVSCLVGS